jgi:hypothetical protein
MMPARVPRSAAGMCAIVAAFGCTLDLSQKHDCRVDRDCLAGRACVAGTCRSPDGADGAADVPNYLFVTSATVSTGLQSLDTADALCANSATAAHLSGQFRAWLSTRTSDARDRLQGARGWIRPDGSPFADTVADIAAGRIFNPPSLDENGVRASGAVVITGTGVNGRADAVQNCGDWTEGATGKALAGTTDGTTGVWTAFTTIACGTEAHIYCFGVDRVATVAPPTPQGKLAFLSDEPFAVGGGLTAADAQCQGEADAAGLAGAFRALLASSGTAASSRVGANGGVVWSRLDGVALNAGGAGTFFDAGTMLAPLNVTSRKNYMDARVFTGAAKPDVPGSDAQTCGNWVGGSGAIVGRANYIPWWFATGTPTPCTEGAVDIYCFQSD